MSAPEAGAYYRPSQIDASCWADWVLKNGGFVVRVLEVLGDRVRVSVRLSRGEWVELSWDLRVFRGMERLSWHEALSLARGSWRTTGGIPNTSAWRQKGNLPQDLPSDAPKCQQPLC